MSPNGERDSFQVGHAIQQAHSFSRSPSTEEILSCLTRRSLERIPCPLRTGDSRGLWRDLLAVDRAFCPLNRQHILFYADPELTAEEKQILEQRVRAPTTSQRDGLRTRIVFLRAEGRTLQDVAQHLQVSLPCGCKWSQRLEREGLAGLRDRPGPQTLPARRYGPMRPRSRQPSPARPGSLEQAHRGRPSRPLARHVARIWRSQNLKTPPPAPL